MGQLRLCSGRDFRVKTRKVVSKKSCDNYLPFHVISRDFKIKVPLANLN
jgi:hypothetical protein